MGQLKQIVKKSLKLKQAGPHILADIDTLLQRSVVRLQNQDLLPPRELEFKSIDRKQEKRVGDDDDLIYHYYYLPDDFRRLKTFRPYQTGPYRLQRDEYELYQKETSSDDLSDNEKNKIDKEFAIVNTNKRDDIRSEKILIAYPFPDDDEIIHIKYWVNGKNADFDWIDEDYWEAIIADIEKMVGLRHPQDPEADQRVEDAIERHKETEPRTHADKRLVGRYFGGSRRVRLPRRDGGNSLDNT